MIKPFFENYNEIKKSTLLLPKIVHSKGGTDV